MSFQQLHAFCQAQTTPISKNTLRDKVIELTGIPGIRHFKTDMNPAHCRGFYVSAQNKDHQFVKQCGCDVIVTARSLNTPEEPFNERFVYVKELMHTFDNKGEKITTPEVFEQVIDDLTSIEKDICPQTFSERKCIWMALMALCPEEKRSLFEKQLAEAKTDLYKISLDLRVPLFYARYYFHPSYPKWAELILKQPPSLHAVGKNQN